MSSVLLFHFACMACSERTVISASEPSVANSLAQVQAEKHVRTALQAFACNPASPLIQTGACVLCRLAVKVMAPYATRRAHATVHDLLNSTAYRITKRLFTNRFGYSRGTQSVTSSTLPPTPSHLGPKALGDISALQCTLSVQTLFS